MNQTEYIKQLSEVVSWVYSSSNDAGLDRKNAIDANKGLNIKVVEVLRKEKVCKDCSEIVKSASERLYTRSSKRWIIYCKDCRRRIDNQDATSCNQDITSMP